MQGKFFPYHAYPAALMNGVAFFIAAVTRIYSLQSSDRVFKLANVIVLTLVSVIVSVVLYQGLRNPRPGLNDLSWADTYDRSTVLAVSSIIACSPNEQDASIFRLRLVRAGSESGYPVLVLRPSYVLVI